MKKYSMKCSCGHVITVVADSLEEAKEKMKAMMGQKGVDDHWMANHATDANPKPALAMVHAQIDQMLVEDASV